MNTEKAERRVAASTITTLEREAMKTRSQKQKPYAESIDWGLSPAQRRTHFEKMAHVDHLSKFIAEKCAPYSHAACAFRDFDAVFQGENEPPEKEMVELVQRAWRAWVALSRDEKLRIMNGWEMYDAIPCILRDYGYEEAGGFVTIGAFPDRLNMHAAVESTGGVTDPVRVMVREGTSREEALSALLLVAGLFQNKWTNVLDANLVENERGRHDRRTPAILERQKERPQTVPPIAPQLRNLKGKKALTAAAA